MSGEGEKNRNSVILTYIELIVLYILVYVSIYFTSFLLIKLNLYKVIPYKIISLMTGMLFFPLIWEKIIHKKTLKETGFNKPRNLIYETITGTIFLTVAIIYLFLIKPGIKVNNLTELFNFYFFINCMIIALSEETFFRGILLRKISCLLGKIPGLIITSIIFAFPGHPEANFTDNLIWRFPVAVILGYIYLRKKSLPIPIIMHLILNLLFMPFDNYN